MVIVGVKRHESFDPRLSDGRRASILDDWRTVGSASESINSMDAQSAIDSIRTAGGFPFQVHTA